MLRPYGMATDAFSAYIKACLEAQVNPEHTAVGSKRVVQTIGDAVASAGTHEKDGVDQNGHDYSAAVDISVKHDLNQQQIEKLLLALAANGFAAWWRHTGSFANNVHVHAVYLGVKMKLPLRNQAHDWFGHRNGLVSHADDQFWVDNLTEAAAQHGRALFLAHNPASE